MLPGRRAFPRGHPAGGYAGNDRHVHRIQVGGWYRFDPPPARSRILTKPAVHADSTSLETATAVVIGPVGPTHRLPPAGGERLRRALTRARAAAPAAPVGAGGNVTASPGT